MPRYTTEPQKPEIEVISTNGVQYTNEPPKVGAQFNTYEPGLGAKFVKGAVLKVLLVPAILCTVFFGFACLLFLYAIFG